MNTSRPFSPLAPLLLVATGLAGCLVDFTAPGNENANDAGALSDAAASCGNAVIDPGESCDGTVLGGLTCEILGYVSGDLGCTGACALDESACVAAPVCGDGVVAGTEACDDGNDRDWDGCTGCGITEFQVNEVTAGDQVDPVAVRAGDGFVILWTSVAVNGSSSTLRGQRYDSVGTADGTPFTISPQFSMTDETHDQAAAASLVGGGFVVVWRSVSGSEHRILARRYDSAAVALETPFDVSDQAPAQDAFPSVAADGTGGFVVVWEQLPSGSEWIVGRGFDADGLPGGASARVDEFSADLTPHWAKVAVGADGGYLVVWTDVSESTSEHSLHGHHYLPSGVESGPIFAVPSDTTGVHSGGAVAATPDGGYVVVWRGLLDPVTDSWDIYARRFGAQAEPLAPDVLVNDPTTRPQRAPTVAVTETGLLVAWQSQEIATGWDLLLRLLAFDAGATGAQRVPHVYLTNWQLRPSAAVTLVGDLVLTWASDDQDGEQFGVFAQRFDAALAPLGAGP